MKNLLFIISFVLSCLVGVANNREFDKKSKTAVIDTKEATLETAIIGGGCFWCTEAVFEKVLSLIHI